MKSMDPLEIVPLASCTSDSLAHHLLRAGRKNCGLLLLYPTPQQQQALEELRTLGLANSSSFHEQVAPEAAPAAARMLHKLGCKLTKATAQRLGEHSYMLHPHLDNLSDWLHPTLSSKSRVQSRILLSRSDRLLEHIDQGLFNLVFGSAHDLASIYLHLDDQVVPLGELLPKTLPGDEGELLGVMIPGYLLQCLDPATPAVPHSVCTETDSTCTPRCTLVLQWRLSTSCAINGVTVGKLVSQFESVRTQQQREVDAEEARRLYEAAKPVIPADANFTVFVMLLTGETSDVPSHPQWTVANLKWSIMEQRGIPMDQQRIIFAGRQLEDGHTLEQCGVEAESKLHLVAKLKGD